MKALILILTISLFVSPAQAQYGGGTGEPNDPYLIYTAEQMNEVDLHEDDWDKHFKLMADIDLGSYKGTEFNLIGNNWPYPFCGVFDGNCHVISNFSYTSTNKDYIGLFRYVYRVSGKQAEIKNLGLIDPNIDAGTGDYVGSLIGWLDTGTITGCYVEGGNVAGDKNVGGLVGAHGHMTPGYGTPVIPPYTISYCYSTSRVKGTICVGGLVGSNIGRITNCYSMGSVFGNEIVGGLVGQNGDWGLDPAWGSKMLNCYSTGHVVGQSNTGGLVGLNARGIIIYNCFWDIQTSGWTTSDGGSGKTTAEMQTASTFLAAGWDFIGEIDNGTEDIWWILEGQDYPRLWWQDLAFSPYPENGANEIAQPLILSWAPGGYALQHDVYFGENEHEVANATIENPEIYRGRQEPEMTTYNPGNLELVKTYYWRIDEVNQADPNYPWKGHLWNFTTADFIVVDDFEDYDAGDNQIWYSWLDGLGYGAPSNTGYYAGNGTGSAVGNETLVGPIMEVNIVHGGRQSMPYWYDNDKLGFAKYSEAEKILSYPRDWTAEGVAELSLWFRGYPASTGSFVEGPAGTFTMTGSGTDIGGWSDQFHFAFKTLNGAGSIVAKVESIENTYEGAKAGVMIREWLDSSSKHAFVCVTPSNGVASQGRSLTGDSSFTMNQTGIIAPHWVKLERDAADNFTAYHSSDGSAWETIGETQNIQMGTNVYVGLALTSHDSRAACEAKFTNVTITGSVGLEWDNQDIGIVTNDLEPMYVAIADNAGEPAVVYHNDPGASGIDTWTEWVIRLSTFADQGIDLTDVDRIAIGFGTRGNLTVPGGRGKMYFDDIRLYQPREVAD